MIALARFEVSERTVYHDIDYFKSTLRAPIKYSRSHGGYYYATPWWQVGVPLAPGLVVGVPTPWTPAWFSYCERKYGHFDRKSGRYYRGGRWVECR